MGKPHITGKIRRDRPVKKFKKKKKEDRTEIKIDAADTKAEVDEQVKNFGGEPDKEEVTHEAPIEIQGSTESETEAQTEIKRDVKPEHKSDEEPGIQFEKYVESLADWSKNHEQMQNGVMKYEESNEEDESFDSILEMAQSLLGANFKKKDEVKNKLQVIMENFSTADRDSLWETFLKTEREIGPFNSFLPLEGLYEAYKNSTAGEGSEGEYREKSNFNIGFLLILLLLLFKENWRG